MKMALQFSVVHTVYKWGALYVQTVKKYTTIECNSEADRNDLLHTDLGNKDACIHDCFDVLKPAWAL